MPSSNFRGFFGDVSEIWETKRRFSRTKRLFLETFHGRLPKIFKKANKSANLKKKILLRGLDPSPPGEFPHAITPCYTVLHAVFLESRLIPLNPA